MDGDRRALDRRGDSFKAAGARNRAEAVSAAVRRPRQSALL